MDANFFVLLDVNTFSLSVIISSGHPLLDISFVRLDKKLLDEASGTKSKITPPEEKRPKAKVPVARKTVTPVVDLTYSSEDDAGSSLKADEHFNTGTEVSSRSSPRFDHKILSAKQTKQSTPVVVLSEKAGTASHVSDKQSDGGHQSAG